MTRPTYQMDPREAMACALAVDRNVQLRYALGILVFGLGLAFFPENKHPKVNIMLDVIGGLIAMGGGYMAIVDLRRLRIRNHPALQLSFDPEQVVWIYHMIVVSMPFGVKTRQMTTVYMRKADGDYEFFKMPLKDVDVVLDQMKELFPEASVGHSVEREQLYRVNPELLRREED